MSEHRPEPTTEELLHQLEETRDRDAAAHTELLAPDRRETA